MIPRIIFQTGKGPPDPDVKAMLLRQCQGWEYRYFQDADCLRFFAEHPLPEFRNIARVFHSFHRGEHKADLFRYYFLYVYGGVYLDTDAMLTADLSSIIGESDLLLCESFLKGVAFNGVLAATLHHPLILEAIHDAYDVSPKRLQDNYLLLCDNLWRLSLPYHNRPCTDVIREIRTRGTYPWNERAIANAKGWLVGWHWPFTGRVPSEAVAELQTLPVLMA